MRPLIALLALSACTVDLPEFTGDDSVIDANGPTIDAMPSPDMEILDPAMLVTAQESPFGFGDVTVAGMSSSLQVIVRNSGEQATSPLTVSLTGAVDEFDELVAGTDDCEGVVLDAQDTCIAEVRFHPGTAGAHAATLVVAATDGGMVSVDLTGNALTPGNLEISAGATLTFANTEIQAVSATQTLTVHNIGGSATAALETILSDETNYTITSDGCNGAPLGADLSCNVVVRFDPTTVGTLPASVSVRESAFVGAPATASGTGTARLQVNKTGIGTIGSTPAGFSCAGGTACGTVSFSQTPIQLTATNSDINYVFDSWTGACATETTATCSVPLTVPLTTVGVVFRQLACTPNTIVCDDATSHYVDCDTNGAVEFEMQCPLGCASGMEKCVDVNPSNGLATYLDMTSTAASATLAGSWTINTDSGLVHDVTNNTDLTVLTAVSGSVRVLMFSSLTVSGSVKVSGANALALVVNGNVNITGTIDVSADGSTTAPGELLGTNPCNGTSVAGVTAGLSSPGGGGGGGYDNGAAGGMSSTGLTTSGGAPANTDALVPLVGGCRGGGASEKDGALIVTSSGGRGGGAIQIVSRTQIALTSTGIIDASGGGGRSGTPPPSSTTIGGGGGGSGGGVLLEAPTVIASGASVVVSTKGGGGAAAGTGSAGHHGSDGGTGSSSAAAGTNAGFASGGVGGTGSLAPSSGSQGTSGGDGGGGGGSVGRTRINTSSGTFSPVSGAAIRSRYTVGTMAVRYLP